MFCLCLFWIGKVTDHKWDVMSKCNWNKRGRKSKREQ
jgi:hypothetical protein